MTFLFASQFFFSSIQNKLDELKERTPRRTETEQADDAKRAKLEIQSALSFSSRNFLSLSRSLSLSLSRDLTGNSLFPFFVPEIFFRERKNTRERGKKYTKQGQKE